MKKKKVLIRVIMICAVLVCICAINSYAGFSWTDLEDKTNKISDIPTDNADKIKNIIATILSLFRYTGSAIAVLAVMITGIKYMVSSTQDKADYKKKLIPMGVGALLLFSASQIIGIVGDIALGIGK